MIINNRLLVLKNHLTPKLSLNSISHYHQFGKLSTNCFDSLEKDLQICNLSSTSSHKPPEKIKESRSNFKHFSSLETRWRDNDIYGHVNNVVYYEYFDTFVNRFLIEKGDLDIEKGETIGVVVETFCQFHESLTFPEQIEGGLRVAKLGKTRLGTFFFIFSKIHFVNLYFSFILLLLFFK